MNLMRNTRSLRLLGCIGRREKRSSMLPGFVRLHVAVHIPDAPMTFIVRSGFDFLPMSKGMGFQPSQAGVPVSPQIAERLPVSVLHLLRRRFVSRPVRPRR